MNPTQTSSSKKSSLISQAKPCISIARPISAKTPAATPTTPPRTSEVIFSVISVFASSISSRTSVETCSETSKTICPTVRSSPGSSGPEPYSALIRAGPR